MASLNMKSSVQGTQFSKKVTLLTPTQQKPCSKFNSTVRASAEDPTRRNVLGGFVTSLGLLAAGASQALDITDKKSVLGTGYDLIYEARDLDKPQNERDGLTQYRANIDSTKNRVKESVARIKTGVQPFIEKEYWTEAREQLRRQVGTLRFDLNTLVSAKGTKQEKKEVNALIKDFFTSVEDLDGALRAQKKDESNSLYATAIEKLDSVSKNLAV